MGFTVFTRGVERAHKLPNAGRVVVQFARREPTEGVPGGQKRVKLRIIGAKKHKQETKKDVEIMFLGISICTEWCSSNKQTPA